MAADGVVPEGHAHERNGLAATGLLAPAPCTTVDYVRRCTAKGESKREIIRFLKRFVAREVFGYLCRPFKAIYPA